MSAAFIYDALRTPFGKAGGTLAEVRPDDLAALVMKSIADRNQLDAALIDDVIFGDANQAGEDNRNVARFAALLAGFPSSVTGTTVNRLCASSMDAVIMGSRAIESGDAQVILAGGVESMSRAPFVIEKSAKPFPSVGNQTLWNTSIGWRMTNPELPKHWTISNLEAAEKIAAELGISREEQDAFAVRSHSNAAAAWASGIFDSEIIQAAGHELTRDEGIRESTLESVSKLKPMAGATGTVTAANSSPISDGASAILLAAEGALPGEPLARVTGRAAHAVDPDYFTIAPIEAANKALARAGKTWADVDFVELNEAFAAQSIACLRGWKDLDPNKLNIHGGAIAMGHPLGASGGRIISHAAHELKRRGGGVAVVAVCIAVGQGLALVLER
ncbi:MAG: thiolase family protein [Micrococcales bacterium]